MYRMHIDNIFVYKFLKYKLYCILPTKVVFNLNMQLLSYEYMKISLSHQ